MKRIALILAIVAILFGTTSFAENDVKVLINQKEITFDDQGPVVMNDIVYVPLRGIMEALRCDVRYNNVTSVIRIYKGTSSYAMRIGSPLVFQYDTNTVFKMEHEPVVINGRTLVPIRYFSELVGADVSWLDDIKTVNVIYEYEK